MNKHGSQWLEALEGRKLMYDPAETDQSADYRLSKYEAEAQAVAKSLMEDKIPDGIASCISRGSDRLGLIVPLKFCCSQAFQDLRKWTAEQGLFMTVGWSRDLENSSEKTFSLAIYPDRGKLAPNNSMKAKVS